MTDKIKFKVATIEAQMTLKEVAKKLDITYAALNKKMNNITEFKSSELEKLTDILKLSSEQFNKIFLRKLKILNLQRVR